MRLIAYPLAAILFLLGIVFVVGSQGAWHRIAVGGVLVAASIALVVAAQLKPKVIHTTLRHQVDLSGDVQVEQMTCNACGGNLSEKSISVKAGTVFVDCEFCGTTYQIEEAPKW